MTGPIYLYGIADAPAERVAKSIEGHAGISGAPPLALVCGGHTVIVTPHDGSEILRTRRRMLAHTRVLEAATAEATVLPMRFGLVAECEEALAGLIEAHAPAIATQFARIAGHAEVGLRISFPREAALRALLAAEPAIAAERDRLAGRGAEAHFARIDLGRKVAEALERRRTAAQRRLLADLPAEAADHVLRAPESDVEVLRAECLLRNGGGDALAERMLDCARACGFAPGAEPEIRLVGPVPPFHFVDLALTPPGAEAA